MSEKKENIGRKVVKTGGWIAAKRIAKSLPVVGTALTIGLVGYDMKKKGVVKGAINSGLDAIPILGTAKGVLEFFTGDLIPDKKENHLRIPEKPKDTEKK
jgi:hypothetical protein